MADSEVRQKFEAWAVKHFLRIPVGISPIESDSEGRYKAGQVAVAWVAWQAGMRAGEIARWIPVEERMPAITRTWTDCGNTYKESDEILIFDSKVGRRTGWLHSSAWSSSDDEILRNVTHWQPLPAAPEERK